MGAQELWIVSYDVDGSDRSTAARVCQIVFGRRNHTTNGGRPRSYVQEGFVHRAGVVWVGQSVLLLPRADAVELKQRLEALRVSVGIGRVAIEPSQLERFRKRARPVSQLTC